MARLSIDDEKAISLLRRVWVMEQNQENVTMPEKFDGPGGVWSLIQRWSPDTKKLKTKLIYPSFSCGPVYVRAYSWKKLKEQLIRLHPNIQDEILVEPRVIPVPGYVPVPYVPVVPPLYTDSSSEVNNIELMNSSTSFDELCAILDDTDLDIDALFPDVIVDAHSFDSTLNQSKNMTALTSDAIFNKAKNMTEVYVKEMHNVYYDIPKCVLFAFEGWGAANFPIIVNFLHFGPISSIWSVRRTFRLSSKHRSCIARSLTQGYQHLMTSVCENYTNVGIFETFSGDAFLGGIVCLRVQVNIEGRNIPAIEILSIVASSKKKGFGKYMFDFCKAMLFSPEEDAPYGIIFAQCVDIPFWKVCNVFSNRI